MRKRGWGWIVKYTPHEAAAETFYGKRGGGKYILLPFLTNFTFLTSSVRQESYMVNCHLSILIYKCSIYFILQRNIWKSYFTQSLIKTRGCFIILNQSHLDKFTRRKSAKLVSNPYFSYGETLEVHTPHQDWPESVSRF